MFSVLETQEEEEDDDDVESMSDSTALQTTAQFNVDILCWFVHWNYDMGACGLASVKKIYDQWSSGGGHWTARGTCSHADLVHEDIRLANLLSTGFILDFDFVRLDTDPEGLNLLSKDGERRPDIATAISNNTIQA
jgi:hypothetical protein